MRSAGAALRDEMAKHGLNPPFISFDGICRYFPGKRDPWWDRGRGAWYVAYPDRSGAEFGDRSTGLRVHWMFDSTSEDSARSAEKREIVLSQIELAWERATNRDPKTDPTPYLYTKEIGDYLNLKVSTLTSFDRNKEFQIPAGLLLVPMYRDGVRVNLQRIYPDGKKLFWPGAETIGAYFPFEITQGKLDIVYICEGWATGWTIWKATGCPVFAAFTAGNLEAVARHVRNERDPKRIIIAADNDRWSKIICAGEPDGIPNPGVHYAREAAEAVDGEVAIPDFEELDGEPTSFDAVRLLDGEDFVEYWLDPEVAEYADTVAEASEEEVAEEGDERDAPEEESWKNTATFRCLGHDQDTYVVASELSGQVHRLAASALSKPTSYCVLAPRPWWRRHFEADTAVGFNVHDASWAIMEECMAIGEFDESRCRGRGCWRTEGGEFVWHLGDRLLALGERDPISPQRYVDGNRIYAPLAPVAGPAMETPMSLVETRRVLDLFKHLSWEDDSAAALAAGWLATCPFSGYLRHRPHLWITGPTESGKSSILHGIISPMLVGMDPIYLQARRTTEAGLLRLLGFDARPVILDDADVMRKGDRQKLRDLVDLARLASTRGTVSRETARGGVQHLAVHSMFLFASIEVGLKLGRDENRLAVVALRNPMAVKHTERWKYMEETRRRIADIISPENGRRLMGRTTLWMLDGRFDELLDVTVEATFSVLQSARAAELYGTLIAGFWTLRSDEVPMVEEVTGWIGEVGLRPTGAESFVDGREFLRALLRETVPMEIGDQAPVVSLGRLIQIAAASPNSDPRISRGAADARLRELGLRWHGKAVHLANQSPFIIERMRGTRFEDTWTEALRQLPGVRAGGIAMRFKPPGFRSHTTAVPPDVLRLPDPRSLRSA